MRTENIGGIQGERRAETGVCPKPTVVHRSSGSGSQENEYHNHTRSLKG